MNDDRERDPNGPGESEPGREPADRHEPADRREPEGDRGHEVPADEASDPVALLRAADPAAGLVPRDGFADEVIAGVAGAPDTAAGPTDAPAAALAADAPVADLAAERARRRRRWVAVAAVAASLVVVGGAGFAAGTALDGTSTTAGSAAPPISLQGGSAGSGGSAHEMADQPTTEQAPAAGGAVDASGKMSTDMSYPYGYGYGYGRNVFSAAGLSTDAGTAAGYGLDPRSASSAATVGALAAALGVEGAPELRDGSWIVGPQDGTAPSVSVGLDGTLSFWFMNPALDPWAECNKLYEEGAAPEEPCEPPVPELPGDDAAIDALRSLIAAAGRDPGAFEFTTDNNYEGAFTRSAQAWPVVDGQRLDQAWSVEVTQQGTYSASGFLAPIIGLGDYEIVSEQEAFERLSDPRFGAQMTAMPYAAAEGDSAATTEVYTPPTEPPTTPADGASISWPVNEVEIVDARLGLASQWQPDGSVLIVPAYEFTDVDGGTWSIIAVADAELDFSAE